MFNNFDIIRTQFLFDSIDSQLVNVKFINNISTKSVDTNLKFKEHCPLKLYFGEQLIEYQYIEKKAKGSYGTVYLYECLKASSRYPLKLCVKVGINCGDLDNDIKILDILKNDTCHDTLIEHQILYDNFTDFTSQRNTYPILLLEYMDDNLNSFFKGFPCPTIVDKYIVIMLILIQVNFCFYHLAKKKLYYVDIKLANCLYRLKDNFFIVKIGDIGSIIKSSDNCSIATFPQIYRNKCQHFKPHVYDIIYGLMILFFEALSLDCANGKLCIDPEYIIELTHGHFLKLNLLDKIDNINNIFAHIEDLNNGDIVLNNFIKQFKSIVIQSPSIMTESAPNYLFIQVHELMIETYNELLKKSNYKQIYQLDDKFLSLDDYDDYISLSDSDL